MNRIDDQLNRLFRAAKKAAPEVAAPLYGLETRAMAAWREGLKPEAGLWDSTILVRGMILALVIMGISLWPAFTSTSDSVSEYLVDSTTVPDEIP